MTTGSSWAEYASARCSSIALAVEYDQRWTLVGPSTRSSSSTIGTLLVLPYTSEVDAITALRQYRKHDARTCSVPRVLVSVDANGSSTMWRTPTAAARWKTSCA